MSENINQAGLPQFSILDDDNCDWFIEGNFNEKIGFILKLFYCCIFIEVETPMIVELDTATVMDEGILASSSFRSEFNNVSEVEVAGEFVLFQNKISFMT